MRAPDVRRYLTIPAQLAPLLFIVIFSALLALSDHAGLFGIPLKIILFAGFCNYSFAVMESMMNGAKEAPTITAEMMNPVDTLKSLVVLAIVIAAFFATGAANHWLGWTGELLVGLVTLAVLLAVVTAQAASGSIAQAFNPWRSGRMLVRLGGDFLTLFACALAVFLAMFGVARVPFLPSLIGVMVLMFGWLAIFSLIGGVLHERREDLGLDEVDTPNPQARPYKTDVDKQRDAQVDTIYGEWRSGAHVNAWNSVSRQLQASADPIAELGWLYERIARWPDKRFANRIAEERVTRLLAAKRNGEALSVISARLLVNPDFRPRSSTDLVHWAELALNGGERRIARALTRDFTRLFPEDKMEGAVQQLRQRLES